MKPIVYTNSDFGAPQLTNTWGSLVNVLKTLLVDGLPNMTGSFTKVDGASIQYTLDSNQGSLNIESIVYIDIGQSTYRFHVKSFDSKSNSYILKCYETIDLSSITGSITAPIKRPSLGYTLAYNDIAKTGKAVFQNSNGWYLRVHDELPKENTIWQSQYGKSARISYGKSMNNIDTWNPYPSNYDTSIPNSWSQPYYLSNSNSTDWSVTKISRNFWTYCCNYYYMTDDISSVSATQNIQYTIIGNEEAFYIIVNPLVNNYQWMKYTYGFGNFDSMASNDAKNAFLLSNTNTPSSIYNYYSEYQSNLYMTYNSTNDVYDTSYSYVKSISIASLYDQSYPANGSNAGLNWLDKNGSGISVSGTATGTFNMMGSDTGSIMFTPMYLMEANNVIRGTLKHAYAILNNVSSIFYNTNPNYNLVNANNTQYPDMKYHIISTATSNYGVVSIMFNLY